jgi:hypothetical protein
MSYGRRNYTSYGPSAIGSLISMTIVVLVFTFICAWPAFLIYAGFTAVDELNTQELAAQECHDTCTPNPGKVMNQRCFCLVDGSYVAP